MTIVKTIKKAGDFLLSILYAFPYVFLILGAVVPFTAIIPGIPVALLSLLDNKFANWLSNIFMVIAATWYFVLLIGFMGIATILAFVIMFLTMPITTKAHREHLFWDYFSIIT